MSFWKTISKVEVGQSKRQPIPMEVVLDDGNVSTKTHDILNKWKADFSHLLKPFFVNYENSHTAAYTNQSNLPVDHVDHVFNEHISLFEVKKVIFSAKQGKACGFDSIHVPSEAHRNDTAVSFLHMCFNIFDAGVIPSDWGNVLLTLSLSHVQMIGETLCLIEE